MLNIRAYLTVTPADKIILHAALTLLKKTKVSLEIICKVHKITFLNIY